MASSIIISIATRYFDNRIDRTIVGTSIVQQTGSRCRQCDVRRGESTQLLGVRRGIRLRIIPFVVFLLALSMLGIAHAGSRKHPPLEKCGVITRIDGKETSVVLPSLRVIEMTVADKSFELPKDAPPHVSAIQCGRSSLIPVQNDYKVLKAGFPFFIVAPDSRILAMELSDGRLQVSALRGKFNADEIPLLRAYVEKAQKYFYVNASDKNAKN